MFINLILWEINLILSIKLLYLSVRRIVAVGKEIVYQELVEHLI